MRRYQRDVKVSSKHPFLNTEEVFHSTAIARKWWDTNHQLVRHLALSASSRLKFNYSNIRNFDHVMPVLAGMKRKSKERRDAAIHRFEKEEQKKEKARE
jgi:hypothetical protein